MLPYVSNCFGKMDALPGIIGLKAAILFPPLWAGWALRKEPGLHTVEVRPDLSSSPSRVWGLDTWAVKRVPQCHRVVMSTAAGGVVGSSMQSQEQSTRCADWVLRYLRASLSLAGQEASVSPGLGPGQQHEHSPCSGGRQRKRRPESILLIGFYFCKNVLPADYCEEPFLGIHNLFDA